MWSLNSHKDCCGGKKQTQQEITIKVQTVDNQTGLIKVKSSMPANLLKAKVYFAVSKILATDRMALFIDEKQIVEPLNHYLKNSQKQVTIQQRKINIEKAQFKELSKFQCDQFTNQTEVQMPCGHYFGSEKMVKLIKSYKPQSGKLEKQYQIKCPECAKIWDFDLCSKVGVFTNREEKEYQQILKTNKRSQRKTTCPNCCQWIQKTLESSNMMICPLCNYGYFCFHCQQDWKSQNLLYCGNRDCKQDMQPILNIEPQSRVFELYPSKSETTKKKYYLPKFRACPGCGSVIQNKQGCKHMDCKYCNKIKFCWVCLEVNVNGKWPCGSFSTFCGKQEPIQKYKELMIKK